MKSAPKKAAKKKIVTPKASTASRTSSPSRKAPPKRVAAPPKRKAVRKSAGRPRTGAIQSAASANPPAAAAPSAPPLPAAPVESMPTTPPIPPLLLEGDTSPLPLLAPGGPGRRYSLGPVAHSPGRTSLLGQSGDLPEAYGTGHLFLAARDPRWLCAAWDISLEEQRQCNARSARGHLTLRTYCEESPGEPPSETDVHHDSRHWFIPVPRAGALYVAELGYRGRDGLWHRIARSHCTATPPDEPTAEDTIRFGTVPPATGFGVTVEDSPQTGSDTLSAVSPTEDNPQPPDRGSSRPPEINRGPATGGEPEHHPAPAAVAVAAREIPSTAFISPVQRPESPPFAPPSEAESATGPQPAKGESPDRQPASDGTAAPAAPPAPDSPRTRENAGGLDRALPASNSARTVTVSEAPAVSLAARANALGALVRTDESRRTSVGSLDVTEWIRRQLAAHSSPDLPSDTIPGAASPPAELRPAPTSPGAGAPPRPPEQRFWFNVNAELVIYGATEPGARVTIGGRAIRLRPDGTFSFRFALPDGSYELPLTAVSIDGRDARGARLQFQRSTHCTGDVGIHPPDPNLPPPDPARVA